MHYFKRNIGDYHKKAGRLSMLQHGAYTLLLDSCYDREEFPTKEQAIEWCWASTAEEIQAVEFVLAKFFILQDGKYIQARIMEEITRYQENANTNKLIAIQREEARKARKNEPSTNREPSVNEPPPNHKPLTTNQEPITPIPPKGAKAIEIKTYIEQCKKSGIQVIPENDTVFDYAQEIGLPNDFLKLAWLEFRDRMVESGKRYKDWRAAFRKYVRGGYLKLWYMGNEGTYELTTAGKQAMLQHRKAS